MYIYIVYLYYNYISILFYDSGYINCAYAMIGCIKSKGHVVSRIIVRSIAI